MSRLQIEVERCVGLSAGSGERLQGPYQPVPLPRLHVFHNPGDFGTSVLGDMPDDVSSPIGQRGEQLTPRGWVRKAVDQFGRDGRNTGMPRSSASRATGDGSGLPRRPEAASGRVRTATTS